MIKRYLKTVSIVIKNLQMICSENGEKTKKCTFRFEKMYISFLRL